MKYVLSGDITNAVKVDAIVTLINPGGVWFGGIDGAIQKVAGSLYHAVPLAQLQKSGLTNGQVIVARRNNSHHKGRFNDVIFVIDDLTWPLNKLIAVGLAEAKEQGYKSVALPLMRSGVMAGTVEPDVRAVIGEMKKVFDRVSENWLDIYVVVYNNPEAANLLSLFMTRK